MSPEIEELILNELRALHADLRGFSDETDLRRRELDLVLREGDLAATDMVSLMRGERVNLTIRMDAAQRDALKRIAIGEGTTVQELAEAAITDLVRSRAGRGNVGR